MAEIKVLWVKKGYEKFALLGEESLKIEVLARLVGISKSSFYHHFADLPVFIQCLAEYHLQQCEVLAHKEAHAKSIHPELIDILVAHKIDLLFKRQLRIHQNNKLYRETLTKSNQIIGKEFILLWAKELHYALDQKQLEGLFELALENFFLLINADNLSHQWLSHYFKNLKRITQNFV